MKRKMSIIKLNLYLSLSFGVIMGLVFPFYSSFFVNFKSDLMEFFFTAGCLMAGICVGAMSYLITRLTIIKVVKKVTKQMKEIAGEDADLTKLLIINSNDEIGDLADAFNSFVGKLSEIIGVTKKNIFHSRETSTQLSASMENSAKKISTMIQNIADIHDQNLIQNEQISKSEESLKEFNKATLVVITHIMEFFSQMNTLTNILLQQAESVDNMFSNITSLSEKIGIESSHIDDNNNSLSKTASKLITDNVNSFEKFLTSINLMQKSIKGIRQISEKTHLLAINTSIEAANAGSKGEGFKVIAGEIHQLSNNASKMIKDIEALIGKISEDATNSVNSTKESQKSFGKVISSVKKVNSQLLSSAKNIQSLTGKVRENYQFIQVSLEKMKLNMEKLKSASTNSNGAMKILRNISDTIHSSIEEIGSLSEVVNESISGVVDLSHNHLNLVQEVEQQVNIYKIEE